MYSFFFFFLFKNENQNRLFLLYIYFIISIVHFCNCKKYMSINILSKIVLFHQVISYGNQRRKSLSENNIYKQHRFVHVYVCVCKCVRACFLFWSTSRRTKLAIRLELELRGSFLRSNSGFFCFAKHKSAGHGFLIPCIRIH